MSIRSDMRAEALNRASHRCEWPGCELPGPLEMAHLAGLGMGGFPHRDHIDNVAILCKTHHDWLDGRLMPNSRRFENEDLLRAVLGRTWAGRR